MKLDPYTKDKNDYSNYIKNLNKKAETIELLEDTIGKKHRHMGFVADSLDRALKAQTAEE